LILPNWQPDDLRELASKEEINALYFVAGYIGFSLKEKDQLYIVVHPESITIDVPTNHHADLKEFINIRGLVDSIRYSLPLL
ncbi:Uncharacterized protein FKW44_006209, partial [Caligus rogercresseyi]